MKKQFVLFAVVGLLAAGSMQAAIQHPDVQAAQARHRAMRKARFEREQRADLMRRREDAGEPQRSIKMADQSQQTRLATERKARASDSRNQRDARLAAEKAEQRRAKAATIYAFFGLSDGASPREILGFEADEPLNRGMIVANHRARIKAWHAARYHDADEQEREATLHMLNSSKLELEAEIGLIENPKRD